jgi:hypothetical protein
VGGYAGNFNGSNDTIGVSTTAINSVASAGTVSAWINPSISTTSVKIIMDLGGTAANGLVFSQSNSTCVAGEAYLQYGTGSAEAAACSTTALPTNTWSLVTATWNSSGGALYINGALNNTIVSTPAINIYPSTAYIGSDDGVSRYVQGLLNDVRLYNRVLTPQEIQAIYTGGL